MARKNSPRIRRKSGGSLLLEIALALSVMGLISGFLVSKIIGAHRLRRVLVTKNNIETVIIALAAHVANHHRLPRPSHNNEGLEDPDAGDLAAYVGSVPHGSLGLAARTTLDGDGGPLIYAVEPFLTFNFTSLRATETDLNSNFCQPLLHPRIIVGNQRNSPDMIAFVVATDAPTVGATAISFAVSENTVWISRDMLLMKYLGEPPAAAAAPEIHPRIRQPRMHPEPEPDPDDF